MFWEIFIKCSANVRKIFNKRLLKFGNFFVLKNALKIYPSYITKCSTKIRRIFTEQPENYYKMFGECWKNIYIMPKERSGNVGIYSSMFTECSTNVPRTEGFLKCSINVYKLFNECSQNVGKLSSFKLQFFIITKNHHLPIILEN